MNQERLSQECPPEERRKWPRIASTAMAQVFFENGASEVFEIENLSAGGALLVGQAKLNPGRPLRVSLELTNHGPITLEAVVVRSSEDANGGAISAVAFQIADPYIEDIIHQAVFIDALRKDPPARRWR